MTAHNERREQAWDTFRHLPAGDDSIKATFDAGYDAALPPTVPAATKELIEEALKAVHDQPPFRLYSVAEVKAIIYPLTTALSALTGEGETEWETPRCRIDDEGKVQHSVNCECWSPLDRPLLRRTPAGPWLPLVSE